MRGYSEGAPMLKPRPGQISHFTPLYRNALYPSQHTPQNTLTLPAHLQPHSHSYPYHYLIHYHIPTSDGVYAKLPEHAEEVDEEERWPIGAAQDTYQVSATFGSEGDEGDERWPIGAGSGEHTRTMRTSFDSKSEEGGDWWPIGAGHGTCSDR